MWPWAHVAVAYLLLAGVCRYRTRRPPGGVGAIAVFIGAHLPDLIDKPLAWWFAVLPSGRSLAHSILIVGVGLSVVRYIARQSHAERTYAAFTLGYLAHLVGDAYQPILLGHWEDLYFLIWPLTAPPETTEVTSIIVRLQAVEPTPFFVLEVVLTIGAIAVWWVQGRPGTGMVKGYVLAPVTR